ncbi:MAG: glycoside hydrolase family 3 N-terminal domain-containing protein [Candidatus Promineifilaceae bacterium]
MLKSLTDEQQTWVEATIDSMTLEQQVGQLLCPMIPHFQTDDWLRLLQQIPLGALFIRSMPGVAIREMLTAIQEGSPIPLLVAGDLEHGAIAVADEGTVFPWPMAAAAADDLDLITKMGRATATEARYRGLHWNFGPVVDLNLNFNNPITNIRSMGDDPDRIIRLSVPLIKSLQAGGHLAATAKHFPGDGVDDRDHHIAGSVNSLPMTQWKETYGQVFQAAVDAGVLSIMPGHISLPDYQGYRHNPDDAPPATLSRDLLIGLLREEMGFDGLIVSDASVMNGLTTRVPAAERAARSIAAGIDMYLFPDPVQDFNYLLAGLQNGLLSEERVRDAARRVLELKARLNLHEDPFGPSPSATDKESFRQAAQEMADKSVTILRTDGRPPLALQPGARVLTVTVGEINQMLGVEDLSVFDDELRDRGFSVTHLLNPNNDELREGAAEHDVVFINVYTMPFAVIGTVRTVIGHFNSWSWRSLFADNSHVVYTAFGSPYLLYEMPHVPNLIATYGANNVQQRAAVKVWLGEIEPSGSCPVRLPKTKVRPFVE